MKKITKGLFSALLVASMTVSFAGCSTTSKEEAEAQAQAQAQADRETKSLQMNDYRGAVLRTLVLKDYVLETMEGMKTNNAIIREDSPNSFWSANGYQDFVSNFLDTPVIEDTQYLNEEASEWSSAVRQMGSVANSFTTTGDNGYVFKSGISVVRNEKDDYSIIGSKETLKTSVDGETKTYSGTAEYRVLYDCDKDWSKTYAKMSVNSGFPLVTIKLYEYQRIDDNTFAIQTSRERLLIKFAPVEADTDIRERSVTEFYYSKLVNEGARTTFEAYEKLPEYDEEANVALKENIKKNEYMSEWSFANEEGDLSLFYGENDSMFYNSPQNLNEKWVFEDKALQQGVVYKDGVLIVTTYNKLSAQYERFIYARTDADKSIINDLEALVVIENLVGVQDAESVITESEAEMEEQKKEETTETPAETDVPEVDIAIPEDNMTDPSVSTDVANETAPVEGADTTVPSTDVSSEGEADVTTAETTTAETTTIADTTTTTAVSEEVVADTAVSE